MLGRDCEEAPVRRTGPLPGALSGELTHKDKSAPQNLLAILYATYQAVGFAVELNLSVKSPKIASK